MHPGGRRAFGPVCVRVESLWRATKMPDELDVPIRANPTPTLPRRTIIEACIWFALSLAAFAYSVIAADRIGEPDFEPLYREARGTVPADVVQDVSGSAKASKDLGKSNARLNDSIMAVETQERKRARSFEKLARSGWDSLSFLLFVVGLTTLTRTLRPPGHPRKPISSL